MLRGWTRGQGSRLTVAEVWGRFRVSCGTRLPKRTSVCHLVVVMLQVSLMVDCLFWYKQIGIGNPLMKNILAYLLVYLLTYLLVYLLTYLLVYLLTYLFTYLLVYLLSCLLSYLFCILTHSVSIPGADKHVLLSLLFHSLVFVSIVIQLDFPIQ